MLTAGVAEIPSTRGQREGPVTHILVSFCRVLRPNRPALGLLHADTGEFRAIRLSGALLRGASATGLTLSERYLYAVVHRTRATRRGWISGPSSLLILDRTDLRLAHHYPFRLAADVHSLWLAGDRLYAVSTGTDAVLELGLRDGEVVSEHVFWRPEPGGPRDDIHHLNAVCEWRGELLVSGFGKEAGHAWSSARDGFVVSMTTGERLVSGIRHPHSLSVIDDRIAYCESAKGAIQVVGGGRTDGLPGYTRGVCIAEQKLFVATSARRRMFRISKLVGAPTKVSAALGQCAVNRLSLDRLAVEQSIDLTAYGREIYELLPVRRVDAWPIVEDVPPRDVVGSLAADAFDLLARRFVRRSAIVRPDNR